jgi:hypothetical protein
MTDHGTLIRIIEALEVVLTHDGEGEFRERLADDWRFETQRRRAQDSIGRKATLAWALRDLTKLDIDLCKQAVEAYVAPSYTDVAIRTLLDFAAELTEPPTINPKPSGDRAPVPRRKPRVA